MRNFVGRGQWQAGPWVDAIYRGVWEKDRPAAAIASSFERS
jgi:hypothetical protein